MSTKQQDQATDQRQQDEQPELEKETLKDLSVPEKRGEDVKGGSRNIPTVTP